MPSEIPEDGSRRLVLDTWTLPLSKLGRIDADNPSGLAGTTLNNYHALYNHLLKDRNAHGVPLGAIKFAHQVFPQPGDIRLPRSSRAHETLPGILKKLGDRVIRQIAHVEYINAELEAEAAA